MAKSQSKTKTKTTSTAIAELELANLLSQDYIRSSSLCAYTPECGVYFLLQGEEIVYVGKSTDIRVRVKVHLDQRGTPGGKDFDRYQVSICDRSCIDLLESLLILEHQPALNKDIGGGHGKIISLSALNTLIGKAGSRKYIVPDWLERKLLVPIGQFKGQTYFWSDDVTALLASLNKEVA